MVIAAQLNERLTVLRPVENAGEAGHPGTAWEPAGVVVRASVQPISGRERLRADQSQATVSHRIEMRDVPGLAPAWRLETSDGLRTFHLQYVARETRAQFIECLATEVV